MLTLQLFIRLCDLMIGMCYSFIPAITFYLLKKETVLVILPRTDKKLMHKVLNSIIAFVLTCGITHLWRFTLLFSRFSTVTLILLILCAVASMYTSMILLIERNELMSMVSDIEIATKGTTKDLSDAFEMAINWTLDLVSVHKASDLTIMKVNNACSQYGYMLDSLQGVPLIQLVHSEDSYVIQTTLAQCNALFLRNNTSPENIIFRYKLSKAHSKDYVHVESSCTIGKFEGVNAVFMVTRNIQERIEQFDRDLMTRNEDVRVEACMTHAMTLAHDLRTPLAVFDLGLRGMRVKTDAEAMVACENSLWFMKFVVDRTVDSCRVLQGDKPVPTYESVNIKDLIENTMRLLDSYPKAVQITVHNNTDTRASDFVCCYEWLWSILLNFLTNACDNTMFGKIELTVKNTDEAVQFTVSDTGVGINPEDASQLFKPFVKLYNKVKYAHGLGIGLFLNSIRIRALGGTYSVQPNPGGGTVFLFSVPLRRNGSRLPVRRPSGTTASVYSSLSVIVVDDTKLFRLMFVKQLRARGLMHIDEAVDGESGLSAMRTYKYDVAFLDLHMPIMNGDICAKEYRVYERSLYKEDHKTKCVLMTADVLSDTDAVLTEEAIDEYISKPLDFRRIMCILDTLL